MKKTLMLLMLGLFVAGCADIKAPGPEQMVRNPMGSGLELGMTKEEVLSIYGDPELQTHDVKSKIWTGSRDEWFYKASYKALPLGKGHLNEDMYLYFDEGSLTNISYEPLGREHMDVTEEHTPEKEQDGTGTDGQQPIK